MYSFFFIHILTNAYECDIRNFRNKVSWFFFNEKVGDLPIYIFLVFVCVFFIFRYYYFTLLFEKYHFVFYAYEKRAIHTTTNNLSPFEHTLAGPETYD